MIQESYLECIHTSGGDVDPAFDLETHRGLIEMTVAVLAKVGAVGVFCWNASMFHHPFVSSEVFSTVTAIVSKTPGTVNQSLLTQSDQFVGVQEQSSLQRSN